MWVACACSLVYITNPWPLIEPRLRKRKRFSQCLNPVIVISPKNIRNMPKFPSFVFALCMYPLFSGINSSLFGQKPKIFGIEYTPLLVEIESLTSPVQVPTADIFKERKNFFAAFCWYLCFNVLGEPDHRVQGRKESGLYEAAGSEV